MVGVHKSHTRYIPQALVLFLFFLILFCLLQILRNVVNNFQTIIIVFLFMLLIRLYIFKVVKREKA